MPGTKIDKKAVILLLFVNSDTAPPSLGGKNRLLTIDLSVHFFVQWGKRLADFN